VNTFARKAVSVAAAGLMSAGLVTALASPAPASTSSKSCEQLGYKTKVVTKKVIDTSGRSYGQVLTLSKASSPTSWCTYVLKAKKYRKKKSTVLVEIETFTSDPNVYSKQRAVSKAKTRSKALTYEVVAQPRENARARVYVDSSIKVDRIHKGWGSHVVY
jgi:hypothetical protein